MAKPHNKGSDKIPEYELSYSKKQILIAALDMWIKDKQQSKDTAFAKGAILADAFEAKDILQRCRLAWKD